MIHIYNNIRYSAHIQSPPTITYRNKLVTIRSNLFYYVYIRSMDEENFLSYGIRLHGLGTSMYAYYENFAKNRVRYAQHTKWSVDVSELTTKIFKTNIIILNCVFSKSNQMMWKSEVIYFQINVGFYFHRWTNFFL